MKSITVEKGVPVSLPTMYVDPEGDGWALCRAPRNGVVIILTPREKNNSGVFIAEEDIRDWLEYFKTQRRKRARRKQAKKKSKISTQKGAKITP